MRIAIVSASKPDNRNTGMLTVDFAAASLLSDLPGVQLNWFTFPPSASKKENEFAEITKDTIHFHNLPDSLEQIYKHDAIIFWGDFLHSRTFLTTGGPIQVRRFGLSPTQIWDIMARCMLLRDASADVLERTLLFGGTILPDKQSDLEDEAYRSAFTRLLSGCRQAWMREPISAARVAMIRNDERSYLGVDAALLLPKSVNFPVGPWSEGEGGRRIGLFVGARSQVTKDLIPFVERLAKRFSAEIDWLPWLNFPCYQNPPVSQRIKGIAKLLLPICPDRRRHELQARARRNSSLLADNLRRRTLRSGTWTTGDLVRQLGKYEFIVTDTYHICINAWRLGVPAICLGAEQPSIHSNRGSLADLKKFIFYLTYQATDLYFTPTQLQNRNAADFAASVLESTQPGAIIERIESHARHVKCDLLETIRQMLKLPTQSTSYGQIHHDHFAKAATKVEG